MGARAYDPSTGRFTTQDPLNVLGSGTNFYNYVRNDPVNAIDPAGLAEPPPPTVPVSPKSPPQQDVEEKIGNFVEETFKAAAHGYDWLQRQLREVRNWLRNYILGLYQSAVNAMNAVIKNNGGKPQPSDPNRDTSFNWGFLDPASDANAAEFQSTAAPANPPPPTNGIASSVTRYNSSGNVLTAVIGVSSSSLQIPATANSTSATANFTVTNNGAVGSLLVYSLQGSLAGGTIAFSNQPSNLASGQSDAYTVTVNMPSGFQAGHTYNGTITITSTDPNVASVPVPVTVTVPSVAVIGVSPNPLNITAPANASSRASTGFTVTNTGGQGSTLVFTLQAVSQRRPECALPATRQPRLRAKPDLHGYRHGQFPGGTDLHRADCRIVNRPLARKGPRDGHGRQPLDRALDGNVYSITWATSLL